MKTKMINCIFEKRVCSYARMNKGCFSCEAPSDWDMTCRNFPEVTLVTGDTLTLSGLVETALAYGIKIPKSVSVTQLARRVNRRIEEERMF